MKLRMIFLITILAVNSVFAVKMVTLKNGKRAPECLASGYYEDFKNLMKGQNPNDPMGSTGGINALEAARVAAEKSLQDTTGFIYDERALKILYDTGFITKEGLNKKDATLRPYVKDIVASITPTASAAQIQTNNPIK
jgi:hypothetical protein